MKRLGLGEHGDVIYARDEGALVAIVYYRDFSGRRRRVKRAGKSKAAARRAVTSALAEALARDGAAEVSAASPFMVGVDAWLGTVQTMVEQGRRSPGTLDTYRGHVERVIRDALGGLRVGEVTTPRVERFLQSVLADKGHSTAKGCRTVLSGACGWLVRQGAMPANPVRDASRIEASNRKAARALSASEVRAWLRLVDQDEDAQRRDLPDLCRFMLATGVRLGEALGVTWSDVDLDVGTVAIDRTIRRLKGQGLAATRVKSAASYRTLVLPEWTVQLLRERRSVGGSASGPVFASSVGGWRDPNNTAKALREVREGSELAWVTSHTFRKTLATLLDGAGESARIVADQLGHSRISMTQDVYMGRRAASNAAAQLMGAFEGFGKA